MTFTVQNPIWKPLAPAFTNVEIVRREINRKNPGLNLRDYHDLHRYSVTNDQFWMDLWEHLGVIYSIPPLKVLESGSHPQTPTWFPGARLNYAENILRYNNDSVACTCVDESGAAANYTFRQLRSLVAEMAAALKVHGLAPGDRVAAIVTNSVNAISIALATASIGGIYTSTAPDMGVKGILDRYRQIRPKFIFVETEVLYAGKTINLRSKARDVVSDLCMHGLKFAVLLPSRVSSIEISDIKHSIPLSQFLASSDKRPLEFAQLPFDHPLFILYTSGTTGPPKCIIHRVGGILVQTMKDASFCFGVGFNDTLLQYTTAGWMMWNFMLAALPLGARLVVYDGSPFHPSITSFLEVVTSQSVSVLGVSPRFLSVLQGQEPRLIRPSGFEALRTVAVGGAVLSPILHSWTQQAFGANTRVMTAMGGTDICTSFVTSVLSLPVYAGEIPCKTLGIKVEVFDTAGSNIEHTGQAGELVCTRPHPSIPLGFWGDNSGEKFIQTYFSTFRDAWRQGDFIVVNPHTKGLIIQGRSDGVLNPRGIRFGSGEIYALLEQFHPTIDDYICVGQHRSQDQDERVLLFIKMASNKILSNALVRRIRETIRTGLTPRHVPEYIIQVKDIPYTTNGKKIEVAIKQIISGEKIAASGAVANPEAFEEYYQFVDIEQFRERSARSKL
ncbi:acetoacetate-CoA ligase [Pluteus cervinus]|uniref:Acetoacetate-CoA ligase n=1 Tax=Pluteus cervinus TaxID=181527 RepID=A0ACD3BCD3_9AGAR|nr:acetoacetate-CoA ligase [Pluteus cervinus]